MRHHKFNYRAYLLGGLAMSGLVQGALGQEILAEQPATEVSSEETRTLETVIVSARQRGERELDVPVATSIVTGAMMEERGLHDLSAIMAQTPGLVGHTSTVANGGGVALRGVKSAENTASIEQAVSINFDGVPISYAGIMRLGQFEIEQVEVLKGPQALYFGKNATGGIVALRSANPTSYLDAMVRGSYEIEADQYVTEGYISGPLVDGINGRIGLRYTDMDGYVDIVTPTTISGGTAPIFLPTERHAPGTEEFMAKGALEFQVGSRGSLMLRAAYTDQSGQTNSMLQRMWCAQGVPAATGGVLYTDGSSECELNGKNLYGNLDPTFNSADARFPADGVPYTDVTQQLYTANFSYDLTDSLKLISITGLYDLDLATAENNTLGGASGQVSYATSLGKKSISQELRVQSDFGGSLNFTAGLFLQKDEYSEGQTTLLNATGGRLAPTTQFSIENETISPFVELDYDITDTLNLSGGLRYTRETKSQTISGVARNLYVPEIQFDNLSPEVTVSYQPNSDVNFYATYRQGYKSGGFQTEHVSLPNALAAGNFRNNSFREETVEGYEIGVKSELLNRALRLQLAAFSYDYSGLQLSRFDPVSFTTIIQSIGGASTEGVEASANLITPVDGLEVYGAVAYNKAIYEKYDAACYQGQTASTGCIPNYFAPGVGGFSGVGRDLPLAPEWSGNMGGAYERLAWPGVNIRLNGQVTYSDSYETRSELIPNSRQGAYFTVDAGVALMAEDERWELAFIGRNLNDQWFATTSGQAGGSAAPGSRSDLYAATNRGREMWLRLTYKPFVQ